MNIMRKWRKFMAVGCSHAQLADPSAIKAVLGFKARFKPDFTAHLGDFIDATALRRGAKDTCDETKEIPPDVDTGLQFLTQLEPQLVLCGNHEDRAWNLRKHHNAIVKIAASVVVSGIEDHCKNLKARLIPWEYKAAFRLGDFLLMHGFVFGENATRDHAEMCGNVIHAHTHRAGSARGRRFDNPVGIGVGTLTRVANMDYAKSRRATLAWSQGFAYGYYTDSKTVAWLCERSQNETKEWKCPL